MSPDRPARVSLGVLVALGALFARRGLAPALAMGISVLTAFVFAGVALSSTTRSDTTSLRSVSELTASAIAWGGAMMHAVVVSNNALRRDRGEGMVDLFLARTSSLRTYVAARVGGLAAVLAAEVLGGTLLVTALALVVSPSGADVLVVFESVFGHVVFALTFALVIAPLTFSTLGGRSLAWGYPLLFLILLVPELLSDRLSGLIPEEIAELCAIPSALSVLRAAVSPGSLDPLRALRALVALVAVSGVATFFVWRDVLRLESEDV